MENEELLRFEQLVEKQFIAFGGDKTDASSKRDLYTKACFVLMRYKEIKKLLGSIIAIKALSPSMASEVKTKFPTMFKLSQKEIDNIFDNVKFLEENLDFLRERYSKK